MQLNPSFLNNKYLSNIQKLPTNTCINVFIGCNNKKTINSVLMSISDDYIFTAYDNIPTCNSCNKILCNAISVNIIPMKKGFYCNSCVLELTKYIYRVCIFSQKELDYMQNYKKNKIYLNYYQNINGDVFAITQVCSPDYKPQNDEVILYEGYVKYYGNNRFNSL